MKGPRRWVPAGVLPVHVVLQVAGVDDHEGTRWVAAGELAVYWRHASVCVHVNNWQMSAGRLVCGVFGCVPLPCLACVFDLSAPRDALGGDVHGGML